MLNLERLRVLDAVSKTGSVAGAARTIHITASAVSQQLGRLQREVGECLVERHGRGIRLTEAGALLAREGGDLLRAAERVEVRLAAHRNVVAGPVAIAAFATAARGLLPSVLRQLRSHYPDLTVSLSEREPHQAIPELSRGDLDLAVVQDWADDPLTIPGYLSHRHLLDDTFDAALPAEHRLADRDRVTIDELACDDWITWSTGQICHDWLSRTLRMGGVEPRVLHTASEHSTQLALVGAGLGTALIPRVGREPAPATVRFVPLTPPLTRRIFALWRQNATERPSIRAVLNALSSPGGIA